METRKPLCLKKMYVVQDYCFHYLNEKKITCKSIGRYIK